MKIKLQNSPFDIFKIFDLCLFGAFNVNISGGNVCIDPIGTDGTYRGYAQNQFGDINQPSTKEIVYYDCNQLMDCFVEIPCYNMIQAIHTLMWDNAGHFILKIGANGDEKFNNKNIIYVDGNEAIWNSTELYYEFTNQQLADSLIPLTKKCFRVTI